MEAITTAFPQLGVAGAAILVLYLMYKDSSARFSRKDEALMEQVARHEETLKEHQSYMRDVHQSTMQQLNHASKVIEDNVKAYERVIRYIDDHNQ